MILYATGDSWLDVTAESSAGAAGAAGALPQPAFAAVDGPACVVWHAARGVSGVVALEGNPRHARALVERQLRGEGSIEGETKIFIHQLRPVGRGYQALYTAAPLDEWQRLLDWAGRQSHHCLLFSTVGLLAPGQAVGDAAVGTVLQAGAQLMFVGSLGGRVVHLQTVGFSEGRDDLAQAATNLGDRLRAELQRLMPAGPAEGLQVDWYEADRSLGARGASYSNVDGNGNGDGDGPGPGRGTVLRGDDAALVDLRRHDDVSAGDAALELSVSDLSTSAGNRTVTNGLALQGRDARTCKVGPAAAPAGPAGAPGPRVDDDGAVRPLAPHEAFAMAARVVVRACPELRPDDAPAGHGHDRGRTDATPAVQGIAALARRARAREALNEPADRWAFIADACLPLCAVIALLMAVGLTVVSAGWLLDARRKSTQVAVLQAQAQAARTRTQVLQGAEMSADAQAALDSQLDFIDTLERLETGHDVAGLLRAVKTSAGKDLRILGIRSDDGVAAATPGGPAVRGRGAQEGRAAPESSASGAGQANGAGNRPAVRPDAEPADGTAAVRSVIVDGMLPDGASAQASQSLSAFVRGLRQQGYRAETIDTRGAASLGTSSQLVSYRLTRMAPQVEPELARSPDRDASTPMATAVPAPGDAQAPVPVKAPVSPVPVPVATPTTLPPGVVDAAGVRP